VWTTIEGSFLQEKMKYCEKPDESGCNLMKWAHMRPAYRQTKAGVTPCHRQVPLARRARRRKGQKTQNVLPLLPLSSACSAGTVVG
jgi:hypothetical protein